MCHLYLSFKTINERFTPTIIWPISLSTYILPIQSSILGSSMPYIIPLMTCLICQLFLLLIGCGPRKQLRLTLRIQWRRWAFSLFTWIINLSRFQSVYTKYWVANQHWIMTTKLQMTFVQYTDTVKTYFYKLQFHRNTKAFVKKKT